MVWLEDNKIRICITKYSKWSKAYVKNTPSHIKPGYDSKLSNLRCILLFFLISIHSNFSWLVKAIEISVYVCAREWTWTQLKVAKCCLWVWVGKILLHMGKIKSQITKRSEVGAIGWPNGPLAIRQIVLDQPRWCRHVCTLWASSCSHPSHAEEGLASMVTDHCIHVACRMLCVGPLRCQLLSPSPWSFMPPPSSYGVSM